MSASTNVLSTGCAYDALTWQETDSRARANTRALGVLLHTRGYLPDALDSFGNPASEYIGECAARELDLDKEDLAGLILDDLPALVDRHQQMHLAINVRLFLADRAAS